MRPVAVIDVGSNSVQMTIAAVGTDSIEVVRKEKVNARLGGCLDAHGALPAAHVEHLITVISQFIEIAKDHDANIRAVATATVRRARNRDDIVAALYQHTGCRLHVVSGRMEAALIRGGVFWGLKHLAGVPTVVVDVGGGSTEVSVGLGTSMRVLTSVNLGGLNFHERHFSAKRRSRRALVAAATQLEKRFFHTLDLCKKFGFETVVATGGTAQRIARLLAAQSGENFDSIDGYVFAAGALARLERTLECATRQGTLHQIPGIDLTRADIMLGGVMIYRYISDVLGNQNWIVSMGAIRTGVLTAPDWPT
ncbi:MAG: Ppx/GppA phosphatase family protein [Bradymonadia bacterium]